MDGLTSASHARIIAEQAGDVNTVSAYVSPRETVSHEANLNVEPGRSAAIRAGTSVYDLEIAEIASAATIRANAAQVAEWLRGSKAELPITLVLTEPVGVTVPRGTPSALEAYGVRLVLRRTDQLAEGYYILTGYPEVGTP